MGFTSFLTIVLTAYTLYYLVVISLDQMHRRGTRVASSTSVDFITAPTVTPVKVGSQIAAASHQIANSAMKSDANETMPTAPVESAESFESSRKKKSCLPYDLGLETLTPNTAIEVASPRFRSLFGR